MSAASLQYSVLEHLVLAVPVEFVVGQEDVGTVEYFGEEPAMCGVIECLRTPMALSLSTTALPSRRARH
jgi:hypothetical protein